MSYDEYDDTTFRERIATNPQPALVWVAGLLVLLALETGRIASGLLKAGSGIRFGLEGAASIPAWVGRNVDGTLGPIAGTVGTILTALLLIAVAAVFVKLLFVPVSLVKTFGLSRGTGADDVIERALVAAGLAIGVVLVVFTPLGAGLEVAIGWLTSLTEWVSTLPSITSTETIPNAGHRTPDGGWEGTFLGLSSGQAWAIRVFVVYAYAFTLLVWIWKGYTTFRTHYREANWTPRDDSINRFRTHYWGIFGLIVVFTFVVMAAWAPALAPVSIDHNHYNPYDHEFEYLDGESVETVSHGTANLQTKSTGGSNNVGPMSYDQYDRWAPMGTTQSGKDLFTFLVFGARTSLVIGIIAIGLGTLIALSLSLVTAYYKGVADLLTVLASDTIMTIPGFLLLLLVSVIFQQANHPLATIYDGGILIALILALVYWPGLWRSIRGPSLQVAEQEWVDAAKSYGQTPVMTMRKHMAPYVAAYIMIYASLLLGAAIIATAALSFLGLGINPPTPEWGRIVNDGRSYVSTASWHISTLPGLLIVLVVTGFNALGDGIRDAMDPESDVESGEAGAAATGGGG
ncbi:ABC transporter permease [Natronosalvus halobius]|uniref:ABC transporter permease n=1 Tax=Natronosalvus halobius TaxID=2953746 RepID=UPI00209D24DC|nr:ABC transporter permease [Natronosalvus halobius]USZ72773.1 ABC transporter permease [Natronosalvus halobius]